MQLFFFCKAVLQFSFYRGNISVTTLNFLKTRFYGYIFPLVSVEEKGLSA